MTAIAKPVQSGRSQAARLPKALRFEGHEVLARRLGSGVLLPGDAPWQVLREALEAFEPGFVPQREQPAQQAREAWPE